ncbi:uncharacterized protein LOC128864274 [Anastrepha ludens]|uniref:uncharacterized protein LOC128864274 n=1 Tax=Anastrepha ludens TaxID=28586 RepID=UPI0023AF3E97|nr:uncharacterized protein LOC128864274 [Anastrepha ludens]
MAPGVPTTLQGNPNEQLDIPKWINEDYFLAVLGKDIPNFRKIISFKAIAATAPGENYCSIMVRVAIVAELTNSSTTQKTYILKTMLDAENSGSAITKNMNMFPREEQTYTVFLPKFMQLYQAAGLKVHFGPSCIHTEQTTERMTLVMEDLKVSNYANSDRQKGLDMPHMTSVLQKLAKMHAASARNFELNGAYGELYQNTFFTEANRAIYIRLRTARDPLVKEAMREWPLDGAEDYIKNFPSGEQLFEEGLRLNAIDPNEFNVLNHGDLWTNNIMFKHDAQGAIDDVLFVDFQSGKWGTPAIDLWFLIITSAAVDIKIKEFDRFIYIYHKQLNQSLRVLNYTKPLPTLKYLQMQMLKYGFWGFGTANSVLSGILLPVDKDASIENFMKPGPKGDALRSKAITNKFYSNAMCVILPFLRHKGLLDFQGE